MELPISISHATIYQGRIPVLQSISLDVSIGEFVFLVGKTGSGKSSLLKTLYGEIPLIEGNAKIEDFELNGLKPSQIPFLRRKLGIIFQDFQLLSDRSALDNLLFVLRATGWKNDFEMKQRALEVLEKVGLQTKSYKFPNELSGGEQQRLVIARSLLNDPKVVLADEPTGNLDPEISDDVMTLLHKICSEGTSVIMATHDYRLIQKFGGTIYQVKDQKLMQINDFAQLNW